MTHCPKESAEQRRLFSWARAMQVRTHRELRLLHAIPNGGSRRPIEASIMKGEGVRSGVPDIHLPVSVAGYHSLYIELKRKLFATGTKYGTVSEEQLQWLAALNEAGSLAVICRGAEHGIKTIEAYLAGDSVELQALNSWTEQVDIQKHVKKPPAPGARAKRYKRTRVPING